MRLFPRSFFTGMAAALLAGLAALGLPAAQASAGTDDYPRSPIRLVIPFVPGGAVDTVGRLLASSAGQILSENIIVENKGGAGGSIGASWVAKSAPDGYTLLLGTSSTHGTNSATMPNLPYDPVHDFAPVAQVVEMPFILVANAAVPANNAAELIAYARANPGKVTFASWGPGSSNHLATELFMAAARITMTQVPYKGAGPAMVDVMSGQVDVTMDTFATSTPFIKSGKVKLLGVDSAKRSPDYPAVQTLEEAGAPGSEAGSWFGIFAPAGTPAPIVGKLQAAFLAAVGKPEVQEKLQALGVMPSPADAGQLARRVTDEIGKWQAIVRSRGLKFD
ncbi:MAG TPA: tripartite tricarboxylate transporter substrate binding protein [Bordetella sp.]